MDLLNTAFSAPQVKPPTLNAKPSLAPRFGFSHTLAADSFTLDKQNQNAPNMNLPHPALVEVLGLNKVTGPQSPEDNFIIKLTENVTNNSATAVCNTLQMIEGWYKNPDGSLNEELVAKKPVILSIRSGGGSVYDGMRIIDQMQHMKDLHIKVITYADGIVGSMASVIVAAGTKGERYIGSHSSFHTHESESGISGKFSDSIGQHQEWQRIQTELNELLSKFSYGKKNPDDFANQAKHDIFITREALINEWGLMDKIGRPEGLYHIQGHKIEAKKAKAEAAAAAATPPESPKSDEVKPDDKTKPEDTPKPEEKATPAKSSNPLQHLADKAKELVGV